MIPMLITSLASVFILLVGFVIGYISKGINITVQKPDVTQEVPLNESLLDQLPTHVRNEIDMYNKGVNLNG